MSSMSFYARRLAKSDVRLILRDKMLITMLMMAFVMGVAARYGLPAIDASLADNGILPSATVSMRFSATYPMFVTFIGLWQAALLPGTVFGFLLLDEKEDDTLTALRVTPVPFEGYLAYRVALPAALAFFFALVVPSIIGHATLPLWQNALLALGAALTAPLATLLLAAFANDKVQGLAYTKFGGVAGLSILIGFFLPEPWQWALGLFPPFLIAKAYWMALAGRSLWWLSLGVGVLAQIGLLLIVVRRFRRVAFGRQGTR